MVFTPVSIAAHFLEWGPLTIFLTSAIAILPLVAWMGTATEEIAVAVGPSLGGLLNATFGNAAELIIALIALKAGLVEVVKSTITGSIIGNLLLMMGLAMFLGGIRYREQEFQPIVARANASAMNLGVIAILLPTATHLIADRIQSVSIQRFSTAIALILIVVYGLTLLFSMRAHSYLYDVGLAEVEPVKGAGTVHPEHKIDLWFWVGMLLAATVLVAIESELLVETLEEATARLGLAALFTGVIVLPIVDNAAEQAAAVTVAMKNKIKLSFSVALGSSLQIALFVAPVLVLAGWVLGQPMDLDFNPLNL